METSAIRRVIDPRLLAAMHDDLQKRNPSYSALAPMSLLVEVCRVLDSWHIVEDAGNNRSKNGRVELLQETIGGHDGEAWCMSTVQSETGLVEAILQLRSNLPASEGCMDVFRQAEKKGLQILPTMSLGILPGDIAIWKHIDSDNGHTGRVISVGAEGAFTTFEGNTAGGPGMNRDGGGAFTKLRDRKPCGKLLLQGFIREQFA